MLNYEKTNENYCDSGVPYIKLEDNTLGEKLFLESNVVKFIREDYTNETIILVKYTSTNVEFEISTNVTLGRAFSMDIVTPIYLKNTQEYIRDRGENIEEIYPVRKLKTRNSNNGNSDYIIVFSTNHKCSDDRINSILKREEKEQLNNTIFKLNIRNDKSFTESDIKNMVNKIFEKQSSRYEK